MLTVLHGTDGGDGGEEGEGEYAIRPRLESNRHIEKHKEEYAIVVLWNAGWFWDGKRREKEQIQGFLRPGEEILKRGEGEGA